MNYLYLRNRIKSSMHPDIVLLKIKPKKVVGLSIGLGRIKDQFVIKSEKHQKSIQSKEKLLKEGNILGKIISLFNNKILRELN